MMAGLPEDVQASWRPRCVQARLGQATEYAALVRHIIGQRDANATIRLDGALRMHRAVGRDGLGRRANPGGGLSIPHRP